MVKPGRSKTPRAKEEIGTLMDGFQRKLIRTRVIHMIWRFIMCIVKADNCFLSVKLNLHTALKFSAVCKYITAGVWH